MEFVGGTYLSQVRAPSPKSACEKWAQHLPIAKVSGLGQKSKLALINEMKQELPVAVKETLNVWCVMARIGGKPALVNIVQTASAVASGAADGKVR